MDEFDVVILGAGAAAKMVWGALPGRSVAVVERDRVGGACPFVACVPSKAMLHSAHLWRQAAEPAHAGLFAGRVDAQAAYQVARARRDGITRHLDDTVNASALVGTGATLLRGTGSIREPGMIEVDGRPVRYGSLVLNTGSTAVKEDVVGLPPTKVWTSDDALTSSEQPTSMVVLGGGAVGCELAFLLSTFGTAVILVQSASRLIPREEPEASAALELTLRRQGVDVRLGARAVAGREIDGGVEIALSHGSRVRGQRVVSAIGRRPASAQVGLEKLGTTTDRDGSVRIDDTCRVVGAPDVWAMGDVTGILPSTHVAHYQGRVVAANLRGGDVRASYASVPRAVYVEPSVVAVGHTLASARAIGLEPVVTVAGLGETVKSVTHGPVEGWLRLLSDPVTDRVIGATAMGGQAEEWISTVSLAIRADVPVDVLADVVHPFPTFGELLEGPVWELASRRLALVTPTGAS